MKASPLVVLASLIVVAGCSKSQPEPARTGESHTIATSAPASSATSHSAPAAAAAIADVAWDAPSAWVSAPNPSPMRKATYKIPKVEGDADDADLSISSASGGVDANITRWEQQFGPDAKAKRETKTPNGLAVTVVEIKGTFASGMPGQPTTPKNEQMLLGAIVDGGDRQHFFKMVGGEKTVTSARADFDKFVDSLRAK